MTPGEVRLQLKPREKKILRKCVLKVMIDTKYMDESERNETEKTFKTEFEA